MRMREKTRPARVQSLCAVACIAFVALGHEAAPQQANQALRMEDYARAESFFGWNLRKLTLNLYLRAVWSDADKAFWFSRQSRAGRSFVLVDPGSGQEQAAFDHARVAAALNALHSGSYTADTLPFRTFEYRKNRTEIAFPFEDREWTCELMSYECRQGIALPPDGPTFANSPDGQWSVSIREHNLWMKHLADGREAQLTQDGRENDAYAVEPGGSTTEVTDRIRYPVRPVVNLLWSPDSSKFVTYKLDESRMKESYLIRSVPLGAIGSKRPLLYKYRYPYPGDPEVATARYSIFNVDTKSRIDTDLPVEYIPVNTALERDKMWWSENGKTVYVILTERGALTERFFAVDAGTGKSTLLVEEHGATEIENVPGRDGPPAVKVIDNGKKVIWFSERDGWGHFYLYDATTGKLEGQVTKGPWTVRSIEYFDESSRYLYFTGSGKEAGEDPYLRHLYRVRLDGTGLELLTPENADHSVEFSPGGMFFTDTYSRADTAPITVLRRWDGSVVRELAKADLTQLLAKGWKFPEPFRAKAADGQTDVYGVIYRPSNFDPHIPYPVVENIYPGPQEINTPKTMPDVLGQNQALAELGFIVVIVDGRGTPLRSRAFHDCSYGHLGDAGGIEDHISALKEMASRYPYMDVSRVGIYGHSAGGFAAARAILAHPEFYKVAVSSAGNHDLRGNIAEWGERYEGQMNNLKYYDEASNPVLALKAPLKGKLLLACGDMDDNVSPALSIQLIDSLIKTNSDFDVLVLPNTNHRLSALSPYFLRRRWDYFVRNLLGKEPPHGYQIKTAIPGNYELEPASGQGSPVAH